jgi:hypothetical protein
LLLATAPSAQRRKAVDALGAAAGSQFRLIEQCILAYMVLPEPHIEPLLKASWRRVVPSEVGNELKPVPGVRA